MDNAQQATPVAENQETSASPNSPLFSTTPVAIKSVPPVIVVGLPRSGSSYLAHILSCFEDLYVFDDLYPYQKAKALNLSGPLTEQQKIDFLNGLSWPARARITWQKSMYAFAPRCTVTDIGRLEQAVLQTFANQSVTWMQILEEWMTRLALHHGCHRWGYKTPQDFQHLAHLNELFPGCQFLYIMRNPKKVMASFKNLPRKKEKVKGGDGFSDQYHPIAYALYWQMAYQAVVKFQASHPEVGIHLSKFEDLVATPEAEAEKIAAFLGTKVTKSVQVERPNTSFDKGKARPLTQTESWICEQLIAKSMQENGYEIEGKGLQIQDLPDLMRTTMVFARYQMGRIFTNKRARYSIASYVKNLFKRL